jgi:general secretion pathway protein F
MSTVPAILAARPISLEQLAALSDEIAALARAGVPLDRGLRALAREMPGRLGSIAAEIGERLESGRPLEQVVADLGTALPPAYQAVVAAGIRSGRLPAAMEGIAHTARRISLLRNSIYLSLVYPLVVLLLTWILGTFVLVKIGPVLSRMLVEFNVTGPWVIEIYDAAARHASWLGQLLPLSFAAWLIVAWYRSGQIAAGGELHPLLSFGAVGTVARMQRASRLASLADLLALLIAHEVPLADSIELASQAVGSPKLARSGKELANRLRCGQTIHQPPAGFPPLLAWTLACGHSPEQLHRSLVRTAGIYRDELARRSQWLSMYIPLMVTLVVCSGAVMIYALTTLGPWILIMRRLTLPY